MYIMGRIKFDQTLAWILAAFAAIGIFTAIYLLGGNFVRTHPGSEYADPEAVLREFPNP